MMLTEYIRMVADKIDLALQAGNDEEVARLAQVLVNALLEKIRQYRTLALARDDARA